MAEDGHHIERDPRVYWIFSLPRSGSSVTAYAGAAALGAEVADEVFGPWDRTGAPYGYPARQAELVRAHHACGCRFTPEVVAIAREVLGEIAGEKGRVVCKHPHLKPAPDEFRAAFPSHKAVWLIRNPLTRLNSLYARGWTDRLRPNYELEHYKSFARHWLAQPPRRRATFEQMRASPRRFYRRLLLGWGVWPSKARVERALEYARTRYHASSGEIDAAGRAEAPVSETVQALPREAVEMYLEDEFIVRLMRGRGWAVEASAYVGE